jgi:hypothetical protein
MEHTNAPRRRGQLPAVQISQMGLMRQGTLDALLQPPEFQGQ